MLHLLPFVRLHQTGWAIRLLDSSGANRRRRGACERVVRNAPLLPHHAYPEEIDFVHRCNVELRIRDHVKWSNKYVP